MTNLSSYLGSNPFVMRLSYRRRHLSTRHLVFLGASVGSLAFLTSTAAELIFRGHGFVSATLGIILIALIALPPYMAYTAGIIVATEVRSESYILLCVTPLSNTRLLEGHILGVLQRLRGPL